MPLEGKLVRLREERAEDMPLLTALRNDLQTQAWSKTLPPDYTEPMYRKRFEGREFSYDPKEGRFIIEDKQSGEFIGTISYTGLEKRFSASIGIMVHKKFWGGGIAFDAQETLLHFLFVELGLRVVRIWTHSGNPRAVGLAEKSGFKVNGAMRQSIFKNGELYDNLLVDLLREEYFALHPELKDNLPIFPSWQA
jgi:RimJ/RimL family protein N-acetyltransferase